MTEIIKNAVEKYQCPGCVSGSDITCYENINIGGCGCSKHCYGTMFQTMRGLVSIFLGMPTGFNRVGVQPQNGEERLRILIFETLQIKNDDWGEYDMFNVVVWSHVKDNTTFIRGFHPKNNTGFLHVILEDCQLYLPENQFIITDEDIEGMD